MLELRPSVLLPTNDRLTVLAKPIRSFRETNSQFWRNQFAVLAKPIRSFGDICLSEFWPKTRSDRVFLMKFVGERSENLRRGFHISGKRFVILVREGATNQRQFVFLGKPSFGVLFCTTVAITHRIRKFRAYFGQIARLRERAHSIAFLFASQQAIGTTFAPVVLDLVVETPRCPV